MKSRRIAIPSDHPGGLHSGLSAHFGHCKAYTIVDIADGVLRDVTVLGNVPHESGGCLQPVKMLKNHNVDTMVVAGMGAGPYQKFAQHDIRILFADLNDYPDMSSLIAAVIDEKLPAMHERQLCRGSGKCHQQGRSNP